MLYREELNLTEPLYHKLSAAPMGLTTSVVNGILYVATTQFSDNQIHLNAFGNEPSSNKWTYKGTTTFPVKHSDGSLVDLSEAKLSSVSTKTTGKNLLKFAIATRGVYSYNLDIEVTSVSTSESGLFDFSATKITNQQAFFNPVNYVPHDVQRFQNQTWISYTRDLSTTGLTKYLSNDFLIHMFSSDSKGGNSMQPIGFFTSSQLKMDRTKLAQLSPQWFKSSSTSSGDIKFEKGKYYIILNHQKEGTAAPFLHNEVRNYLEWLVNDIAMVNPNQSKFEVLGFNDAPQELKMDKLIRIFYANAKGTRKWWIWIIIGVAGLILIAILITLFIYIKNKKAKGADYELDDEDGYYQTKEKYDSLNQASNEIPSNPNESGYTDEL